MKEIRNGTRNSNVVAEDGASDGSHNARHDHEWRDLPLVLPCSFLGYPDGANCSTRHLFFFSCSSASSSSSSALLLRSSSSRIIVSRSARQSGKFAFTGTCTRQIRSRKFLKFDRKIMIIFNFNCPLSDPVNGSAEKVDV